MTSTPTAGFLSITVGEISPFPPLPVDQLTVSMSLKHPIPVIRPPGEIDAAKNVSFASQQTGYYCNTKISPHCLT